MKNIKTIKAALDSAQLVYEELEESVIRLCFDDCTLIIGAQDENSTIQIGGYTPINMPEDKWPATYELLNTMNLELAAQCYLDSDGDLKVKHVLDVDDIVISEQMVMATLARVIRTLNDGREQLMRLRFS